MWQIWSLRKTLYKFLEYFSSNLGISKIPRIASRKIFARIADAGCLEVMVLDGIADILACVADIPAPFYPRWGQDMGRKRTKQEK